MWRVKYYKAWSIFWLLWIIGCIFFGVSDALTGQWFLAGIQFFFTPIGPTLRILANRKLAHESYDKHTRWLENLNEEYIERELKEPNGGAAILQRKYHEPLNKIDPVTLGVVTFAIIVISVGISTHVLAGIGGTLGAFNNRSNVTSSADQSQAAQDGPYDQPGNYLNPQYLYDNMDHSTTVPSYDMSYGMTQNTKPSNLPGKLTVMLDGRPQFSVKVKNCIEVTSGNIGTECLIAGKKHDVFLLPPMTEYIFQADQPQSNKNYKIQNQWSQWNGENQ